MHSSETQCEDVVVCCPHTTLQTVFIQMLGNALTDAIHSDVPFMKEPRWPTSWSLLWEASVPLTDDQCNSHTHLIPSPQFTAVLKNQLVVL